MKETLLKKAKNLPKSPGCYLMYDKCHKVIYVGKAINLRNRVVTYFNNSQKGIKTTILVSKIVDFDFILASSEGEAYVLENNLIKEHSPKYNIRMRDDKSYPYIVIDRTEPFPRLKYTRQFKRSNDIEVYGPFAHGSNVSEVLKIINKSFQLRDCTLREFNSRREPCLLYQIKQCSAPCVSYISKDDYEKDLSNALNFFKGNGKKSLKILKDRMAIHAEKEEFEKAAFLRDSVECLKSFLEYTREKTVEMEGILSKGYKNIDLIAYFEGELELDISIYLLRNGILLGQKTFHFPLADMENPSEEEVLTFLIQYYTTTVDELPELILSPFSKELINTFQNVLNLESKTISKKIIVKGFIKKFGPLYKMCEKQAFENQRMRLNRHESVIVGLNKLQELLNLRERPLVIECYDVAIWQGRSPTASQIVFRDGVPDKKLYRYYHLKERPEGNNDFEMLKEVLSRRLKYGDLPDVFVVDGGKGQANSFREVLKINNISIPVVGLAKAKVTKANFTSRIVEKEEERIFLPGRTNPYILKKNMSLLKILVKMRDEAHRFSRKLHHKKEKSNLLTSWLDDISGIGPQTKKKILKNMDCSLEDLKEMTVEEIKNYLNINQKVAQGIKEYLNSVYE